MSISPQGYTYGKEPTSEHPFWDASGTTGIDSVSASASVDDTTGTPSVSVTNTGTEENVHLEFAFKGLKGETGAKGEQGAKGETGATGPQGAQGPAGAQGIQGEPGKDGTNGISPTVVSTGATASGAIAGTITGADGNAITVYNGAQGETGPQGATGPQGPKGDPGEGASIDTSQFVTGISVTNANGVYEVSETKGGQTQNVGQINVPDVDNLLAEVNDSIVENTSGGYDYHTITETEHNGVQNDVGSFYIARKQITALNSDGSFTTVDQSGYEETGQIVIPEGSSLSVTPTLGRYYTQSNDEYYTYPDINTFAMLYSIPYIDGSILRFSHQYTKESTGATRTAKVDDKSSWKYTPNASSSVVDIGFYSITYRNMVEWSSKFSPILGIVLNGEQTISKDGGTLEGYFTDSKRNPITIAGQKIPATVSYTTAYSDGTLTITTTKYKIDLIPGQVSFMGPIVTFIVEGTIS